MSTIVLVFATCVGAAQEVKLRLDSQLQRTDTDSLVSYTLELTALEEPRFNGIIYTKVRKIKARGMYVQSKNKFVEDGPFVFFHDNGKVESEGLYEMGVKVGVWKRYAADGTPRPDRFYDPAKADLVRAHLPKPVDQK